MRGFDADYAQLIHQRAEANLAYIAARLRKADEAKWEQYIDLEEEGELPPIPEEIEQRLSAFARDLDKQVKQKARRKRLSKIAKRCAIILVAVGLVGAATIPGSAWKYNIAGFFTQEQDGHTDLVPYESDLLEDWHDYYILDQVPEGYTVTSAVQDGEIKGIIFSDGQHEIRMEQWDSETKVLIDNEYGEIETVNIKGKEGRLSSSAKNDSLNLSWWQNDRCFMLWTNDKGISREELISFAEDIKYIE